MKPVLLNCTFLENKHFLQVKQTNKQIFKKITLWRSSGWVQEVGSSIDLGSKPISALT